MDCSLTARAEKPAGRPNPVTAEVMVESLWDWIREVEVAGPSVIVGLRLWVTDEHMASEIDLTEWMKA